jgi:hypothetical protein
VAIADGNWIHLNYFQIDNESLGLLTLIITKSTTVTSYFKIKNGTMHKDIMGALERRVKSKTYSYYSI